MNLSKWMLAVAVGFIAVGAHAEAEDAVDKKRPIIAHVPVTTVLRGQPADINATITPQDGGAITSVTTQVKLALAGKPIEFPMSPSTGDVYKTLIPVSAIEGVNYFWYFIHSLDSNGRMADTIWHRVRIIDAAHGSGGAAAGGSSGHKGLWIGGALLLGGAAAAIIANNDGGGDGDGDTPPIVDPPPPPKKNNNNNNNNDDEPPCILTGNETVSYNNLGAFDESGPIEILVCNTCPDADISASATWGESDSISGYNNSPCVDTDQTKLLILNKPDSTPQICESETISVFANGQLIDTLPWPQCSDFR